jgi:hypothetical protein
MQVSQSLSVIFRSRSSPLTQAIGWNRLDYRWSIFGGVSWMEMKAEKIEKTPVQTAMR